MFFDVTALTPTTSEKIALGAVTVSRGNLGVELAIAARSDDRLYDVILEGERAWSAFPIEDHGEMPCLVLDGTRIQVDPRSEVAELPQRGDMLATINGWALRCTSKAHAVFDRDLDALVVAAELDAQRYRPRAYRSWQIVTGAAGAETVIFGRSNTL